MKTITTHRDSLVKNVSSAKKPCYRAKITQKKNLFLLHVSGAKLSAHGTTYKA